MKCSMICFYKHVAVEYSGYMIRVNILAKNGFLEKGTKRCSLFLLHLTLLNFLWLLLSSDTKIALTFYSPLVVTECLILTY